MAVTEVESGHSAWAAIARKDAVAAPPVDIPALLCHDGLKAVVVDANAIIGGGVKLPGIADQFFTVKEVLEEVRDPASRKHLVSLPVTIKCLEPSEESLSKVIHFASATGDLQSLSEVDLKLIALVYTLEALTHGTTHINTSPPTRLISSTSRVQRDPPGWGTAMSNPEEWKGVEDEADVSKSDSHILSLKVLQLDSSESSQNLEKKSSTEHRKHRNASHRHKIEELKDGPEHGFGTAIPVESSGREGVESIEEEVESKPVPSLGKKVMVAEGLDASKGEHDENGSEWQKALSRSTRRNHLRRAMKRAAKLESSRVADSVATAVISSADSSLSVVDEQKEQAQVQQDSNESVCLTNGPHSFNGESKMPETLGNDQCRVVTCDEDISENCVLEDDDSNFGDAATSIHTDDVESEQSWAVAPLWRSSIACMTGDFAMQNVLLQMGLRLLSPTGIYVRELHKWLLKCQACGKVTSEGGRIFCPKCGNGGTLFKVSVTVGANGVVHAGRNRRVNLRGTRYSLPMPKGGREGVAQNPILREDQLPHKLLYPKTGKSSGNGGSEAMVTGDGLFKVSHKNKEQKVASVKAAAAIFGGRRNPNEKHGPRKC